MRWWRESALRRWMAAHPFAMDAVLAAVIGTISLVVHFVSAEVSTGTTDITDFHRPTWWTVALTLATCAPLATRRRCPEISAVTVITLQSVLELFEVNSTSWLPSIIIVYSLGAHGTGRRRSIAVGIIAVMVAALLTLGAFYYDDVPLIVLSMLSAGGVLFAAFLVGDLVKRRRLEVVELAARVERAERERELLAAQQVSEERARIARELHDVVAHSVSVMVIQATAARRNLDRDPESVAGLLDNITATGRQTMSELRQILGVLRTEATSQPEYAPVLGDLDALSKSLPGVDVTVRCDGSWDRVPPSIALQAYRVIQEALTNTHRHVGARPGVEVDVEIREHELELRVTDNGRGASAAIGDSAGSGYGLVGMRERAAAFGGTLRAGPRRSGGWEVAAVFPTGSGYPIDPKAATDVTTSAEPAATEPAASEPTATEATGDARISR